MLLNGHDVGVAVSKAWSGRRPKYPSLAVHVVLVVALLVAAVTSREPCLGDFVEAGSTCTALVPFLVGLPVALLLALLLAVWSWRDIGRSVILVLDALIVAVPLAIGLLPSDFVGFVVTRFRCCRIRRSSSGGTRPPTV
jgi:hypothetical protein